MTSYQHQVLLLQGGQSAEHEVSMISASRVLQHLDKKRFNVTTVTVHLDGRWQVVGSDEFTSPEFLFSPDNKFDVVLPIMHGALSEDGTLQGMLAVANIAYVGCGVLSSAVCMEKDISKRLVEAAGLPVVPYESIRIQEFELNKNSVINNLLNKFKFPLFIKPANTGSSVGISKVANDQELLAGINLAFQYDLKVVVEPAVVGREIEVAVLGSASADSFASLPGEIRPNAQHGFYSYAAKYLDENGAQLLVPAELDDEAIATFQSLAVQIFTVLECEGMARVDFFLEDKTNNIYFNEVNTIPGFTEISMYPRLMAASGIECTELLTRLIDLALDRHKSRSKLQKVCDAGEKLLENI